MITFKQSKKHEDRINIKKDGVKVGYINTYNTLKCDLVLFDMSNKTYKNIEKEDLSRLHAFMTDVDKRGGL